MRNLKLHFIALIAVALLACSCTMSDNSKISLTLIGDNLLTDGASTASNEKSLDAQIEVSGQKTNSNTMKTNTSDASTDSLKQDISKAAISTAKNIL